MIDETSEVVALNLDELSNTEVEAMLSELPTTKAEFFALAKVDRQRIAEGQHDMRIRLPLVAGPDRKIDDADFVSQVECLWAIVKASDVKPVAKPGIRRRRRGTSRKI